MLMSWVVTGIAAYPTLNVAHPVSQAAESIPATAWLAPFVNVGAIVGLRRWFSFSCWDSHASSTRWQRTDDPEPVLRHHPLQDAMARLDHHRCVRALGAGVLPPIFWANWFQSERWPRSDRVAGIMILRVRVLNARRPFRTPVVWVVAPPALQCLP
jgi:APA family basic amino acid/polyamine antiporter